MNVLDWLREGELKAATIKFKRGSSEMQGRATTANRSERATHEDAFIKTCLAARTVGKITTEAST